MLHKHPTPILPFYFPLFHEKNVSHLKVIPNRVLELVLKLIQNIFLPEAGYP